VARNKRRTSCGRAHHSEREANYSDALWFVDTDDIKQLRKHRCRLFLHQKRIQGSLVNMKRLAAVAFIALLSGCSSTEVVRQLDLSVGQQLIDLKKARDNGALSASEYEDQRRKLIRNVE
jgi:hypothetical protein